MSIKPKRKQSTDLSEHWLEKLRATSDLRVTFNFSFLSADERYNLTNPKVNLQAVMSKVEAVSQRTWIALLNLPKKSGLEQVEKKKLNGHLKELPLPAGFGPKRAELSTDKLAIIRFNAQQSRLIGKLIDQTFYLFWIDTNHELYAG